MAIPKTILPLVFNQGINTKLDPKQQMIGVLRSAKNVTFDTINALKKRNGYDQIALRTEDSVLVEDVDRLTKYKRELLAIANDRIYSYSTSAERLSDKGGLFKAMPSSLSVLQNSSQQDQLDSLLLGNFLICVYHNDSLDEVRYSVQDCSDGSLLVSDDLIGAGQFARVSNINNAVYVVYGDDTDIAYRRFDITQPKNLGSPQALAANLDPAKPLIDVVSGADKLFVAYNSTVGSAEVRVIAIDSGGNVATGVGITGSNPATSLCIYLDSAGRVIVNWSETTALKYCALNYLLTMFLLPTTTVETISNVCNTSVVEFESVYHFYYEISAANTYDHLVRRTTANIAGTVQTPEVFIRSLGLACKPVVLDSALYLPCVYESSVQSSYFLLNESAEVMCKWAAEVAGGLNDSAVLPSSWSLDTKLVLATFIKTKNVSDNGTFFGLLGVNRTFIELQPAQKYNNEILGENLHISGGIVQMYDGDTAVEHGFHNFPATVSDDGSYPFTSGSIPAGSYGYIAVYRWTDNAGQEHYSIPSIDHTVNITASNARGTFTSYDNVVFVKIATGAGPNGETYRVVYNAAVANPTNTILADWTGSTSAAVLTITPNNGTNNGAVPVGLTSAELVELQNTGAVVGKSVTVTGSPTLRTHSAAYGGSTTALVPVLDQTITFTGGAATSTYNARIPTLRITAKENVVLELYRTEKDGSVYYLASSATVPTFNDKTVDYVVVTDNTTDAILIAKKALYTTGGVLENDAPPPASYVATHTASDRLFLIVEDSNVLQYSKQRFGKAPVEFNGDLTMNIDTIGGTLTAAASMDEKLVVWAKDATFFINGSGPNNLGQNDNFSLPERVSIDVGCTEPASVVLTPDGLMFKSRKGIYLLSRGLQLEYIGAPVEEYNDLVISSAKVVPKLNQVRFTTTTGDCLVYNYFLKLWCTFDNHQGLSAETIDDNYYYIRSDSQLFKENYTSYADNGSPISIAIETGWMSFNELQGFQRVYKMLLLATYKSEHQLRVQVAYDFNDAWVQEVIITPTAEFLSGTTYGEDSPYGSGTPYGGDGDVYQARFDFARQKCQAFKMRISDVQAVAGEGLSLSVFTLQVGAKTGLNKPGQNRVFGTR
jgi:hypothetical protein